MTNENELDKKCGKVLHTIVKCDDKLVAVELGEVVRLVGKTRTYPDNATQEYWGIKLEKLYALRAKFVKIAETNPKLGQELLSEYGKLMTFNVPIVRYENGTDFVLTTDTGRVVASGKFIEPLKDVTMESMDYFLSEEADPEEVQKALNEIDILEYVK